jgi:hypothetical protein
MWDWALVEDAGARLENMVAAHLLRLCHYVGDVLGEDLELRYFRDMVGHEVDFVLLRRHKPWIVVEVKRGDRPMGRGLKYLLERVPFALACQVSQEASDHVDLPPIRRTPVHLMPAHRFLGALV